MKNYNILNNNFDQVNMSRAGINELSHISSSVNLRERESRRQSNAFGLHHDQSLDRMINQKQSAYHNELVLQQENDFLHLRLQQLSKDNLKME